MWRAVAVLGPIWIGVLVTSIVPQLDPYAAPDGAHLLEPEGSDVWGKAYTLADDAGYEDVICDPSTLSMACRLPCILSIQWYDGDREVGPRFERQEPSPGCDLVPLRDRTGCRTVTENWHLPGATDGDRSRWIESLCPQFDPSWVDP